VQRGERQRHLGLDPDHLDDVEARRGTGQVTEQRALADARIAPKQEHLALPATNHGEQFLDRTVLSAPPDDFLRRRGRAQVDTTFDARP
jgi:hypothetical protein